MFKDKKLLIFDLDGTLVDSAPDLELAVNDMLTSLGRETFSSELIHSWVGNGAQTLVKRALSGSVEINENIDMDEFNHALDVFLNSYAKNLCVHSVLYPNVSQTLKELQVQGFRLALVTNKSFDFVAPLLSGLGIDDSFELCLGGDSLAKKKPDPMPLLHVSKSLGVEVNDCLMVGDSKNDILAAKAAGMHSIGVSYGYNYGEAIDKYEPEVVVHDFKEISLLVQEKS